MPEPSLAALIRVGAQPQEEQKYLVAALKSFAEDHIKWVIDKCQRSIDKQLPNMTPEIITADAKDILKIAMKSLSINDNLVTRHCDYTGIPLSWSEGPGRISLEAIYPYTIKHITQCPMYVSLHHLSTLQNEDTLQSFYPL